jgi:hypothetical protein
LALGAAEDEGTEAGGKALGGALILPTVKVLVEILAVSQRTGGGKAHEAPEIEQAVLQRGAGEDEAVLPDKGAGGKYLILPPGYTGEVPEGFIVVRPTTYRNWVVFRSFLVDGKTAPAVEGVRNTLKIYPLAEKDSPKPATLVNASGVPANFVMPTDYRFWELLNQVIQEEPTEGSDPTTLGLFAAIGIEKGKPFAPDARMKDILTDAANIGAVTARALALNIRGRDAFFYPDSKSSWRLPFFGGYRFQSQPGVSNLDGAAFYYFFATGVTPATLSACDTPSRISRCMGALRVDRAN